MALFIAGEQVDKLFIAGEQIDKLFIAGEEAYSASPATTTVTYGPVTSGALAANSQNTLLRAIFSNPPAIPADFMASGAAQAVSSLVLVMRSSGVTWSVPGQVLDLNATAEASAVFTFESDTETVSITGTGGDTSEPFAWTNPAGWSTFYASLAVGETMKFSMSLTMASGGGSSPTSGSLLSATMSAAGSTTWRPNDVGFRNWLAPNVGSMTPNTFIYNNRTYHITHLFSRIDGNTDDLELVIRRADRTQMATNELDALNIDFGLPGRAVSIGSRSSATWVAGHGIAGVVYVFFDGQINSGNDYVPGTDYTIVVSDPGA